MVDKRFRKILRLPVTAGFLVFVLLIFLNLPASSIVIFLPKNTFSLEWFHGTIWRGGAVRSSISTPKGPLNLGHIEWKLMPLSWLKLSPEVKLRAEWGEQSFSGIGKLGFGDRIEFLDLSGIVDASALNSIFPLSIGGIIHWELDHLSFSSKSSVLNASGRLDWRKAKTFVKGKSFALGSYSADLSTVKFNDTRAEIRTIQGPVLVNGLVTIDKGNYSVNLSLDGLQEVDTNSIAFRFLQLLPLVDGIHQVKLKGNFL